MYEIVPVSLGLINLSKYLNVKSIPFLICVIPDQIVEVYIRFLKFLSCCLCMQTKNDGWMVNV